MNDALYRRTRQCVAALVSLSELESSVGVGYELELRFGTAKSHQFVPGMAAGLWYAVFQYMSGSPNVRIAASFSMVEIDETDATARIVHSECHRKCYKERKTTVIDSTDLSLLYGAAGVVRVAASSERRLADDMCNGGTAIVPQFLFRRRERRSVYLIDPITGRRSYWRFDFTRINDKEAYELELELELPRALAHTHGLELSVRTDAIMAQFQSLIDCLLFSINCADQMHAANEATIAAERQRREQSGENAKLWR
jgi:hypothetical protein